MLSGRFVDLQVARATMLKKIVACLFVTCTSTIVNRLLWVHHRRLHPAPYINTVPAGRPAGRPSD